MSRRLNDETALIHVLPADVQAATRTTADFDVGPYIGQAVAVLSAEVQGTGITNTIKFQSSELALGASMATAGDADNPLNLSTSGKTKLAATFTQAGARSIKHVDLILKKAGTINATKVLTLTIESDSTGEPDGTPLGTAGTVLANTIDTAYQTVRFTFATPVELADATAYWIVLTSDYDASDTNYIAWSVSTVASGGNTSEYAPSAWAAVATQDSLFKVYEYNFTDVTGGAFTAVGNTATASIVGQKLGLDLDSIGGFIRVVSTVAGGSSVGAVSVVVIAKEQHS